MTSSFSAVSEELAEVERKAIASTLDVVVHEFSPRAATFFTVGSGGDLRVVGAHAPHLSPRQLRSDVHEWVVALHGIDPLAPARLPRAWAPVATLADVGGAEEVLRRPYLGDAYRRIGTVNEARLWIRDGERLVAGVTLWRALDGAPAGGRLSQQLAALQPLVEMAYRKARRAGSPWVERTVLAGLTQRQGEVASLLGRGASNREIARALGITEATARSHTRAVMARLGVSSRRDVVLRLNPGDDSGRA